jgi:hypothetical protein
MSAEGWMVGESGLVPDDMEELAAVVRGVGQADGAGADDRHG